MPMAPNIFVIRNFIEQMQGIDIYLCGKIQIEQMTI